MKAAKVYVNPIRHKNRLEYGYLTKENVTRRQVSYAPRDIWSTVTTMMASTSWMPI